MCNDKHNNEETKSQLWIWIIIAIVGVIALWGLSWILIDKYIDSPTGQGTFGDKFGAVNALFSGLAFAGLIVTLLYQKEELKLQREELAQTREELKGQREEFEEQNKTMKRQRFENTFFNMLSLQQEIVTKLSYTWKHKQKTGKINPFGAYEYDFVESKYMGREVFEALYNEPDVKLKDSNQSYNGGIKSIIKNKGIVEFENICDISNLDHYYRHLYRLFKYVDSSPLITKTKDDDKDEYEERYDYACIIRSQLSDYELVMLFYNCLTANGLAKFKPLIEKYSIFNNLRIELLADIEHKKLYDETAYNRYTE